MKISVIIEPYWNWKVDVYNVGKLESDSYNWTLLELKAYWYSRRWSEIDCYNWTLLELKVENNFGTVVKTIKSYNWTLLELKVQEVGSLSLKRLVIIEPYWNWKVDETIVVKPGCKL